MDGLNPPNVNPIDSNSSFGSASPVLQVLLLPFLQASMEVAPHRLHTHWLYFPIQVALHGLSELLRSSPPTDIDDVAILNQTVKAHLDTLGRFILVKPCFG